MIAATDKRRFVKEVGRYFFHPCFVDKQMKDIIMADMPGAAEYEAARLSLLQTQSSIDPVLRPTYEMPLLTPEQEAHLFRKFNYLKYKTTINLMKGQKHWAEPRLAVIEHLKHHLAKANFRLSVNTFKSLTNINLPDHFSDGYLIVYRAVDRFDFTRGTKFSTYCVWALRNEYKRHRSVSYRHSKQFVPLDDLSHIKSSDGISERAQMRRNRLIERLLRKVEGRDREIIERRFGLGTVIVNGEVRSPEPQTLKEIGEYFGVTKERVRQIEARVLRTLLSASADMGLDFDLF